jgi:uncharacterized protein YlzI (FlbEa/FlbD family)
MFISTITIKGYLKVVRKNMDYTIDKIDELPKGIRQRVGVYDNLIAEIGKKDAGVYVIAVGTNKAQTVYQQLYKHIKGKEDLKDLKLHKVSGKVYIVKEATIPRKK